MAKKKGAVAETPLMIDGEYIMEIFERGPIDYAKIGFRPGRITQIGGSNGAGKSEVQRSINNLATGNTADIRLRDGAERGRIAGLGREINFTLHRCNVSGELEVLVVEQGFSLAHFVNPGSTAADPNARAKTNDKYRIQDLATILGINIETPELARLVGGQEERRQEISEAELSDEERAEKLRQVAVTEREVYRGIVSDKTTKQKDAADKLASLKDDCDRAGLENERLALTLKGEIEALKDSLPEAPEDAETDAQVLSKRVTDANNAKAELERQNKAADDAERLAKQAEDVLKTGQGQTVEAATKVYDAAKLEVDESEAAIAEAEAAIARERIRLEGLQRRLQDAKTAKTDAEQRATELQAARDALAAKTVRPTDTQWAAVEAEMKAAEDAMILGGKLREAADARQKIADKEAELAGVIADAEHFRSAGRSAMGLLVDPINALQCGIEIDDAQRVVFTQHPTRGRCYVEELSLGESTALVIRLLVAIHIGADTPAIMVVPQEFWEGLDPINVEIVKEEVAKTQMMFCVAKASAKKRELLEPGPEFERDQINYQIL